MQLLALYPRDGPDTIERFNLRHKWAIKLPTMPDGSKFDIGLSPRYEDWLAARAGAAEDRPAELRSKAMSSFTQALGVMRGLLFNVDLGADPRDFLASPSFSLCLHHKAEKIRRADLDA